jgi:hypothetical protein
MYVENPVGNDSDAAQEQVEMSHGKEKLSGGQMTEVTPGREPRPG